MYRGRTSHAVAILNRQMMMTVVVVVMMILMMMMITMTDRWDSGGTPLRVTLSPAFLGLKSRGGYR